ncbi:thioredoxin-dependent thiol peroxidase [Geovibrio thiophilus]|uniref:thioredoxin-dependent peroxiredoxin n=1 Tax=Geovibrio thiophilus TaxID=139438 RepID=A0A410JZY7_9BACT|nr:thioredoxin-dependent thiol peroxidase [Geovibrio thiophilus]QAR33578.1 thioredoxin-dependent thiol peroxidase [Geovibrio thiophilus]
MAELKTGDPAPDFSLEGDDGKVYSLSDFSGKKLILYFYPKDNTPGCTTEAREFTALVKEYAEEGCKIIGVSPDSAASHKKFKEKQNLDILLLSDPDKICAAAFGAYGEKKNYGVTYTGIIRSTFVIDTDGTVLKVFKNVKAKGHAEKVLCELR